MSVINYDGVPTFVPGTTISIRHISVAELEIFEVDKIAFIKPVMTENGQAFAIHAADGAPMAIASTASLAAAMIIQNEMLPRLVH
jgi:Protein of unknown function (DUF1150)